MNPSPIDIDAERPFWDEIVADFDNDFPRLVHADWLDEMGDVRGEVIRLQCEIDRMPEGSPDRERRRRDLHRYLPEAERTWTRMLSSLGGGSRLEFDLQRGLPEVLRVIETEIKPESTEFFERFPICRGLRFGRRSSLLLHNPRPKRALRPLLDLLSQFEWRELHLPSVADSNRNQLDRVRVFDHLAHYSGFVSNDHADRYPLNVADDRVRSLRSCGLRAWSDAAFKTFADSDRWGNLERLDLTHSQFDSSATLARFLRSLALPSLRSLRLGKTRIAVFHLQLMAESGQFDQLEALHIEGNNLGDDAAEILANPDHFPSLRFLKIHRNPISEPWRKRLRERYWM